VNWWCTTKQADEFRLPAIAARVGTNMKANWMLGTLVLLCFCGCRSDKPQQASSEKALQIGDCLVVQFDIDNGQDKTTTEKVMDRDGNIVLPDVGKIHIAGMRLQEVGPAIERALFSPAIFHHVEVAVTRCK
jgi:protein involved in polysaccharide export with SLBB domain